LPYIRQEVYDGILDAAKDADLSVSTCRLRPEDLARTSLSATFQEKVDGFLIHPGYAAEASLFQFSFPAVIFGSHPVSGADIPTVEGDNLTGMRALIDHLHGLGHRRFEFVSQDYLHTPFQERARVAENYCATLGATFRAYGPFRDRVTDYVLEFTSRKVGERPTAVLCGADSSAVELMHSFLSAGVRVPDDVSVVGFDGYPWAANSVPPLTTWRPDWHALGEMSLNALLSRIAGKRVPARTLVGGELIIRQSTGRAVA